MSLVSVIALNWNRKELLRECLESLERQTFRDLEVIVVDNGSTDGSVELVRQRFAWTRLVSLPHNCGFSGGNNIGIRHATGTYIALLSNDVVASPGWLTALVSTIEKYPEVGFCASRILFYDQPELLNSTGILYFPTGEAIDRGWMQMDGPQFSQPDYPIGACAAAALYRRAMLEEIGLFDEEFSPAYYEDVDLSLRAQLRGYRCAYVPAAVVHHRFASTMGYRSPEHVYLCERNRWYALIKNVPLRTLIKYGRVIVTIARRRRVDHVRAGEGRPFVSGQLAALRKLPLMMRKRREIQRRRTISAREFEALLTVQPQPLPSQARVPGSGGPQPNQA